MRSRIACSAALAVLLAGGAARADQPTAEQRAVAETLFKDAKALMKRGKIPEACEKLASSYKIDPAGGTLLNLAMCHEVEGKTATAWTEFNEALSLAKRTNRKDRQKAASEHIAALEARLSRVTITAPRSGVAGLVIKIDGEPVSEAAIGTAIPVNPGERVVTATAPGKKPFEVKLVFKEGQPQEVTVPALESDTPPPPPPPPPSAPAWQKPVGFTAIGVGAALLGVGSYFGARAISLGNQATAECPAKACSPAGLKAVHDGRVAANVANGTLVAGGVLAAGGAALVIIAAVTGSAEPPRTGRVKPRIEVLPAVAPDGISFTARGVF